MSDHYEPELGQAMFGQPSKMFKVSSELEFALQAIDTRLYLKMVQRDKNFMSPFGNSGNGFACDTFSVEAYSWNDDVDQEWNFKWRDLEVSWYKYLGRGMSANRKMTIKRVEEMLDDCFETIRRYEVQP